MDTKKMRACAPLLPEPGNEVVLELLDEIERLCAEIKTREDSAEKMTLNGIEMRNEIERLRAEIDEIKQVEFPRRVQKVADGWRGKVEALEAEIERLCAERDRFRDGVLTLGTELRAIETALDDERINLTHTAAQVAAEMRDKINELHAQIETMRKQEPVAEVAWAADIPNSIIEIRLLPGYVGKIGDKLYLAPGAQPTPNEDDILGPEQSSLKADIDAQTNPASAGDPGLF